MRALAIPAAATLAALGACSPYGTLHEEMYVRVLPEQDELHVLEVQRGLHASRVEVAGKAIDELLAGKRIYPPGGGLLTWDLDASGWAEKLREEYSVDETLAQRLLMLPIDVSVERTGLFLEGEGPERRLGLYRLTRVARLAANLDLLNDLCNFHLKAKLSAGEDLEFVLIPDRETLELWRRHVEQGRPWFLVQDGAPVLEIPLGSEKAATTLRTMLASREESQDPDVSALRRFELLDVTQDRAWLRLPERLMLKESKPAVGASDAALLRHYLDRGYDFGTAPALAEIRALLDRR